MCRKFLSVLAVSLWVLTGVAEDVVTKGDCPPSCPPVCPKPYQPCPPCPPKPCCKPPPRCCWKFNPCNPKKCSDMNCGSCFISADFLYWRAENHGFGYAYEFSTTEPAGLNQGKVVRIQPDWEPAFRVGLGWNIDHDFWDMFLNYTWYRNSAKKTETSSLGFIPLWPLSNSTAGQFGTVRASSRFMMNMGDLEIGRLTYLTCTVALRPYFGVRGGTIYQRFRSNFTSPLGEETNQEEKFRGRNNYWGVGPRAGFNGEWHFSQRFSLLGKLAGALLYGKTDARSKTSRLAAEATSFVIQPQYTDDFYQLVPNLQLALGFQWQTCFWCEQMFFKISASWEANYWWNQFNLPVGLAGFTAPFPTVGNQPLTMEGLVLNLEWDF